MIEKEFEALYMENIALKQRIGSHHLGYETFTPSESPSLSQLTNLTDEMRELSKTSKKATAMRHKWKSAFRAPSGRIVTSLKVASGNTELSKARYTRNFTGHTDAVWDVASVSFSNVKLIASASADQTAKIWNADNGQCLLNYTGHNGSVNSITLSTDKNTDEILVLTASGDKTAHLWKSSHLTSGSQPNASSEDDLDATSDKGEDYDGHISNIPINLRHSSLKLTGHSNSVVRAVWLSGGKHVLTASWDRSANIYDGENGKILNVLTGHDQELTYCDSHQSGKLVATASKDFTFRLWDFRDTIQSVAVFQGHNDTVTSAVFSSSYHIVSGSDDRTVKVWDLRNMRCPISEARLDSPVNRLAVYHQQNLVAIPHDNRNVSVYDLKGMRALTKMPRTNGRCHHRMVSSATWLPDHETNNLITCSIDKQIIGWKLPMSKA